MRDELPNAAVLAGRPGARDLRAVDALMQHRASALESSRRPVTIFVSSRSLPADEHLHWAIVQIVVTGGTDITNLAESPCAPPAERPHKEMPEHRAGFDLAITRWALIDAPESYAQKLGAIRQTELVEFEPRSLFCRTAISAPCFALLPLLVRVPIPLGASANSLPVILCLSDVFVVSAWMLHRRNTSIQTSAVCGTKDQAIRLGGTV